MSIFHQRILVDQLWYQMTALPKVASPFILAPSLLKRNRYRSDNLRPWATTMIDPSRSDTVSWQMGHGWEVSVAQADVTTRVLIFDSQGGSGQWRHSVYKEEAKWRWRRHTTKAGQLLARAGPYGAEEVPQTRIKYRFYGNGQDYCYYANSARFHLHQPNISASCFPRLLYQPRHRRQEIAV